MKKKEEEEDSQLDSEFEENCWEDKSNFQMALILIHFVAVPFFIVMVAVYLAFFFVWNKSENCEQMCKGIESFQERLDKKQMAQAGPNRLKDMMGKLPKGWLNGIDWSMGSAKGKRGLSESMTPEKRPMKGSKAGEGKKRSPCHRQQFIAALLEDVYMDENDEFRIRCLVAVLSRVWVLTLGPCLGYGPLDKLSVRFGSRYWSQGGELGRIQEVAYFEGMVALKLDHEPSEQCFQPVNVLGSDAMAEAAIFSFRWGGNKNETLDKRRKFEELKRIRVVNGSCADCEGLVAPVVDQNDVLIGFQSDGRVSCYVNETRTRNWLRGFL